MIRTRTAIAAAFMVSMAFTASSLSPAQAAPAKSGDPAPVFVARADDQTWGEAILSLAASSEPSAEDAAKVKDTWDARSNGEPAKVSVSSEGQ